MTLLSDSEIAALLAASPPLVSDIDRANFKTKDAPIQASSVDLSIGGIFVPGIPDKQHGGSDMPASSLSLAQGEMAVIRTKEKLSLPSNLAGFGFPPSRLSIRGLLVTNPGHVDPGYQGSLHLTVINMGRHPIELAAGDPIITLLFIRMGAAATYDYAGRRAGKESGSPVNQALLSRLSKDFLDVQERTASQAKEELRDFEKRQNTKLGLASIAGGALLLIVPFGLETWRSWTDDISPIKAQIEEVEKKLDALLAIDVLDDRIKALEDAASK
jgi:deoxycytidine triphosphate deaminase